MSNIGVATKITITYPSVIQDTIMGFGQLIKIKGHKRVHLMVINTKLEDHTETYTMKPVYKPSPKSRLKNKSVFSKFKMELA
jgi:hypothetical protein